MSALWSIISPFSLHAPSPIVVTYRISWSLSRALLPCTLSLVPHRRRLIARDSSID
ncbi:hypothetical protein BDR07DRAFT_1400196, partial [Suillus spraguei]